MLFDAPRLQLKLFLGCLYLAGTLAATEAGAAVTFYTDEAAWTAAVDAAAVDSFDTTAANLALADELEDPELRFRARAGLWNTHYNMGNLVRALAYSDEGLKMVEANPHPGGEFWGNQNNHPGRMNSRSNLSNLQSSLKRGLSPFCHTGGST